MLLPLDIASLMVAPIESGSIRRTRGYPRRPNMPENETFERSDGRSGKLIFKPQILVAPLVALGAILLMFLFSGSTRSRTPQRTTDTQRGSYGQFGGSGLNDSANEPSDLHRTFDPGTYESRGSRRSRPPVENILDRSPTPPYATTSVPSVHDRSNKELRDTRYGSRRSRRDYNPGDGDGESQWNGGVVSRHTLEMQIERELGIEIKDPNAAATKTFVRPQMPLDLLDSPVIFHPRVGLHVAIMQPLYSGGGILDGRLDIHIRGTRLDNVRLGRMSIDIAGIEGAILASSMGAMMLTTYRALFFSENNVHVHCY